MLVSTEARFNPSRTSVPFRILYLRTLAFCAVLVLFLSSSLANAQTQEPVNDADIVRVSTELLLFPIRIRDKRGQPVSGLTEKDLSLKDQDHVTSGLYFLPGADHVALLFALDRSGSLRHTISQQREAALALFGRFSDRSTIAIQTFAEKSTVVAPFQKGTEAASAAFRFAPATNQHTAIFDAAADALKTFDSLPPNRAERRIVILISDGLDNASSVKANDVIDAALVKRVSFYIIHLPLFAPIDGHLAVRPPTKGFRELGDKTGGKYFLVGDVKTALLPDQPNDLTPVFQAIEDDLRSQYLLGFYINESSRDGRRHTFSLSLVPAGIEYTVGPRSYSRTQKFFVQTPKKDAVTPR
ncbi:MAG TPA: VWA domain-containing protein [Pyrinomonadaceae bacterium]|nr:VWA domain-containing protein [Pyrinomonadaceae bacterium]